MVSYMEILYWVGLALLVVAVLKVGAIKNSNNINLFFIITLIMAGGLCYSIGAKYQKANEFYSILAEEVDLKQVSAHGISTFRMQVDLVYENGKLRKLFLVPKTTTKLTVAK